MKIKQPFQEMIENVQSELDIKFFRLWLSGDYILETRKVRIPLLSDLLFETKPYIRIEDPNTLLCEEDALELSKKIAQKLKDNFNHRIDIIKHKNGTMF